jgi:hypothetical protein
MAINKVDLTVSQLINDLNSGLTWFKKDDLGYGSIETKYGATAPQIMAIRKHPALKDAETNITIFNIIDDTKNDTASGQNSTSTKGSTLGRTSNDDQQLSMAVELPLSEVVSSESTSSEAADIFANL